MPADTLILSNGDIEDYAAIRARLAELDQPRVLAADGGIRHAARLGLTIDAAIGDLDSTDAETLKSLERRGVRIEKFPAEKDEIDLELALQSAIEAGSERIIILGALGSRVDMTAANLLLLAHPGFDTARIEIWHAGQTARYVRSPGGRIEGAAGDTISLIPVGGDAEGITSEGLAYPLNNDTLLFARPRGISNVMTGPLAQIRVRSGGLIVVHTPGRA